MHPRPSQDTTDAAAILELAHDELAHTRLRIARLCVNGLPNKGLSESRDALYVLKTHIRNLKGETERQVSPDLLISTLEELQRELLEHRKML